ncbi:MAG: SgcJ/EcaC family oxidoreductase [Salaquimonas sp.]|jgi:uncharacterized protein (TIGR02246 family)|nr:SgcJ/EcaC family oxidoreductase [Salaquimonas sp.]
MSSYNQSNGAVDNLVDALLTAWNVHDAHAFAASFSDDADFTNVFGMRAHGRDEIEKFHAPIFETMFAKSTLSKTGIDIRWVRPDVAAIDVNWHMTGARDPHGNEWPARRGLMNLLATCEGDRWSLMLMHNMDLPDTGMAEAQDTLQQRAQA